jgi:hypothetical protein
MCTLSRRVMVQLKLALVYVSPPLVTHEKKSPGFYQAPLFTVSALYPTASSNAFKSFPKVNTV